MRFNRKEHCRFVRWLDRTAEKNPVFWLPCIILLAIILGLSSIAADIKTASVCQERITTSSQQKEMFISKKPFALRVVAITLVMAFSVGMVLEIMSVNVNAEDYNEYLPNAIVQNDFGVNGSNSFGYMFADAISKKNSEQEENNGYNVFSVEMNDNIAVVDYESLNDSTLVVGIYDETGQYLLTTGNVEISSDEAQAQVLLDSEKIPQYFYIKAYIINSETMRPLCTVYECPTYTQEMQDFLSKTVDDFNTNRVLNLDEDRTNNFAVFSEDTIFGEETSVSNNVIYVDNENEVYVIDNADDTIKGLQTGDIFSHKYGNNELLIIKVSSIDIVDNTVTIYGDTSSIEEVFEYVKINSIFDSSDAIADTSDLGEGTEYTYTGGISSYTLSNGISPFTVDAEGSAEFAHSFKFTDKNIENYSNDTSSANVKLNGSLDLKIEGKVKLYISWSETYIELKLDYSAKLQLTFSETLKGKIPLAQFEISPFVGVFIRLKPAIEVELSGKISLVGKLSGSFGVRASTKTGAQNISSAPKFEHNLSAEGKFYIGFTIDPKVVILSEKVANAGITGKMGVEVKADLTYGSVNEKNGTKHDCTSCIDGDISIKFNINAEVSILDDMVTFKLTLLDKSVKLADFYRSDDYGDSGFTTCPHISYKVSASVYGENSKPAKNALIECKNGNSYITDSNGKVDFYLPSGEYTFKISNDKYSTIRYIKVNNKPVEFSEWLDSLFFPSNNSNGENGDNNGGDTGDNPVNPTPEDSDFTYTISDNEITITGYIGTDTDVVIPDTIEGLPVVTIGQGAFYHKVTIESVKIPNSVTTIKRDAFMFCDNLTTINIPDNVTTIGLQAFYNCYSLLKIQLPQNLQVIEQSSFHGCSGLVDINFPENVSVIEQDAFGYCKNIMSLNIPKNIVRIGANAFEACENLQSISIYDTTVISITGAFDRCNIQNVTLLGKTASISGRIPNSNLKNVTLSDSVTSIADNAFNYCTNLVEIVIPSSVKTIGENAFMNCKSLQEITIPSEYIGNGAFQYCSNLNQVSILEGVTTIGSDAFFGCTSLKSITIPKSIKTIGQSAFYDCISLESISIPNNIDSINKYAFYNCSSLESVIIPESVTEIGHGAFWNCVNLKSINIPQNVTVIDNYAFSGCTELNNIIIPEGMAEIGPGVFRNCNNLTSITIPYSVTSIDSSTFENCYNLTIYSYTGSYAETFASKYKIPFKALDVTRAENSVTVNESNAMSNNAYEVKYSATRESTLNSYATFTDLIPNEVYNCYGMKSRTADNPFGSDNLFFIMQAVSDSSGTLTFNYSPCADYSQPEIFIKAMTEFDVLNATIIAASASDDTVKLDWNAVPSAQQYKIYKVINGIYIEYKTTAETSCTIDKVDNFTCGFIVQTCVNGEWSVLKNGDVLYYNASNAEHTHQFGSEWKNDSLLHWHECECGEKSDVFAHTEDSGSVTVQPTATSSGVKTYSCTVCGYVMRTETIPALDNEHTHSFTDIWQSDSTYHWHKCDCGEKSDVSAHTEDSGIVTVQPTAVSAGVMTYSCRVCGYVMRTAAIPPTGDYFDFYPSPVPPTPPTPIYPEISVVTTSPTEDEELVDYPVADDIEVSLKCRLSGLSEGTARLITKKKFFDDSAIVSVSQTTSSKDAAKKAVAALDGSSEYNISYPFDITIYNAYTNEKMALRENGYITLEIPVPKKLANYADDISVYHIAGGEPELLESSIIISDESVKIHFTAFEFSPFMFNVHTEFPVEDVAAGAGTTANEVPIDAGIPVTNGVSVPNAVLPQNLRLSNKKRRYRILRKRRLDDLVFVY